MKPLVSVKTITYNHEPYIRQCIEGVLMQKTDFPIEYVIGEDCSTDGTREIVAAYAQQYPDVIRLITSDRNVGARENALRTREICSGEYVAVCEGDDYWIDPLKLQKQVDFLESHTDCAFCFHSVYRLSQATGETIIERPAGRRPYYALDDIISMTLGIPTASVVFRNRLVSDLPTWYLQCPFGDMPLWVLLAQHGRIGFLDEVMGVYRIHAGGAWQGADEASRTRMSRQTMLLLRAHLGPAYETQFRSPLANNYLIQAWLSAEAGQVADAKVYIRNSISSTLMCQGKWVDQIGLLGRLYLPRLWQFWKWFHHDRSPLPARDVKIVNAIQASARTATAMWERLRRETGLCVDLRSL